MDTKQQKEKPHVELLAKLFSNFKDPEPFRKNPKQNEYVLGSKNFTKMVMFAIETQLDNNDIDFWCHQLPKRSSEESYESYKQRMIFTKLLNKYRPFLYNYNVYNVEKKHSTKRAKKVMKELGIA